MKPRTPLGRQIAIQMTAVVLLGVLIALLGMYLFYVVFMVYWPSKISEDAVLPSTSELVSMVVMMCIGAIPSAFVAGRLSRRILEPLASVTEGLRKLADGDLAVRATANNSELSEVAHLVDDFNRMAERLEALSKERLFWNAAIAHELRTPVTILSGRLQGLTDGVFEPTRAQFLGLLKQVEGLKRLVEDLRVVGLADNGHLDIQVLSVNLAGEINSVVHAFEPGLQAVGITPRLSLGDGNMRCDPARIRQALAALLENARRYAVEGEVHVEAFRENDRCFLRVSDDGPGIDDQVASTIFEAFQRGESQLSRDGTGSGLGLAVVRAIAHAHGGTVRCYASATGGSSFELSWPMRSLLSEHHAARH